MKLGKREIDALTCPPERRDMLAFDDDLTGFALRVTSKGTKTFLFQYRRGQAVRRLRLGEYGDLTPTQARRLAEVARGRVAAGGDPAKERHADIDADAAAVAARKQAMQADSLTFANLIDAWETRHLCYRRAYYRAEAVRALRFSLATLANVPAHAVGVAKVRQALEAIPRSGVAAGNNPPAGSDRPRGEAMARRVRDYGRAMYAWAMKNDLLTTNPFAKVTAEGRDQPRERVLSDSEIGEIWRATDTLGWPWGAYIRFLLLTLQREGETAGMRWAELGPELATWELPGERTKNGKPHLVHLAEPARAILRTLPRLAGAELVFTTTGKTPVSGFSAAKARLAACRT